MTDNSRAIYHAVAYLSVVSSGNVVFHNQETMSENMYSISDANLVTVGYPWVLGGNPASFTAGYLAYSINDIDYGYSLYHTNSLGHYNYDATGESSNMCSIYASGSGTSTIYADTGIVC
ncbi:MAG: hypothetical protein ACYC7D_14155 [Nitrososphaerales archaeon]